MRRVLDTFAIPRTTTYNKYDKQRTTTIETIDSSSETNRFFFGKKLRETHRYKQRLEYERS